MKSLDGLRRGYDPLDTSDLKNFEQDMPEYNSGSEWFEGQLQLEKPSQKPDFIAKDKEVELKDMIKDCERLLSSKRTLLDI